MMIDRFHCSLLTSLLPPRRLTFSMSFWLSRPPRDHCLYVFRCYASQEHRLVSCFVIQEQRRSYGIFHEG
jgi:hypothetical protein